MWRVRIEFRDGEPFEAPCEAAPRLKKGALELVEYGGGRVGFPLERVSCYRYEQAEVETGSLRQRGQRRVKGG